MNTYSANLVRNYQENAVYTASPVKLIVLLYEGAIRSLRLAERHFAEGKLERARSEILQAEKILLELINTLNFAQGGDIAKNLFALYQFILRQCASLSEENTPEMIPRLVMLLEGLKEAWQELAKNAAH